MHFKHFNETLRAFVSSRPPLLLFMLCLTIIGVVLMSIGLYVKYNDIRDPDITVDWNTFLKKFTDLEYCLSEANSSSTHEVSASTVLPPLNFSAALLRKNFSSIDLTPTRTFSIFLSLLPPRFASLVSKSKEEFSKENGTRLVRGFLTGDVLGLRDSLKNASLAVSFELPSELLSCTSCPSRPVCVLLSGPAALFPLTFRHPSPCESSVTTAPTIPARKPDVVTAKTQPAQQLTLFSRPRDKHTPLLAKRNWCKSPIKGGHSLKFQHNEDLSLTVMLSLSDRSLINLHLLHTSYFLFVMIVTLMIYSLIKGKNATRYRLVNLSATEH